MNQDPSLLWLSISSPLKCFDKRLLSQLAKAFPVRQWEYCQSADEPCCVDLAVAALHQYVGDRAALEQRSGNFDYKIHLLGHGISGVVALLYAKRYPERVASLTLLSVNAAPAINWQAQYYALRQLLPCSREIILAQTARILLGEQPTRLYRAVAALLKKDLDSGLTLHSLARRAEILIGDIEVPLLVCNGAKDSIVCNQKQAWHEVMKPSDRLWQCSEGNHFFHFHHAEATASIVEQHILGAINSSARSSVESSADSRPSVDSILSK